MAHHYESGFQVEQPAWHNLGVTIPAEEARTMTIPQFMTAAEMDWSVLKLPLQVPGGEAFMMDGNLTEIPSQVRGKRVSDNYAIFRDKDWSQLGVVGAKYTPLQNVEAFNWFQPWLDAGTVTMETAGSLHGGAVIWVMAKLNQADDEIIPDDFVRRYILLSTSHDGSQATRAGFTDIRTVCANTLAMAHRSKASQLLKVRHMKTQLEALDLVRKTMDLANQEFSATAEQYRRMARKGIHRDDLVKYVKMTLDIDTEKKLSTKMQNIVSKVVDFHDAGRGSDMTRRTVWGAYNAVTEYLSYDRGRSGDTRLHSLWFGESSKINQRALDLAIELCA